MGRRKKKYFCEPGKILPERPLKGGLKKALFPGGFTLIELLLVSVLVVFTGTAVYRAFVGGIAVYKWIERDRPAQEMAIFFEKVADDLRNICPFPEDGFTGMPGYMSFYVHNSEYLIFSEKTLNEDDMPIRRVEYEFDPHAGTVMRRVYGYGAVTPRSSVTSMRHAGTVKFGYLPPDRDLSGPADFLPVNSGVPRAVKVEITTGGPAPGVISRVVDIPASGG